MNSNPSILDNPKTKEKCQRFTPPYIVAEMLHMADYAVGKNIFNSKILEHSFGSGNILEALVKDFIIDGRRQGFSNKEIAESLSNNIYGFELDTKLYRETLKRLHVLLKQYGIPKVKWRLFNRDPLFWNGKIEFDFIIGNPPYVTYSEINPMNQLAIRKQYSTCANGKFDYYYPFIEFSIARLSPKGKLVQLVPSSLYKNVYAKDVRALLREHIKEIILFPSQQLFEDTETSTSIFLYDAQEDGDEILCENKTVGNQYNISRDRLGEKWILSEKNFSGKRIRFGDYFTAFNPVATLLNEAFLISDDCISSIEQDIIRPAASPKTLRYHKEQYIIFPYKMKNGNIERFSKEEFERKYPQTVQYLKKYETKLSERKADDRAEWFEYGRSQALQRIHQKKLLLSTVITNTPVVYLLDKKTVPFTGIFIIPVKKGASLNTAKRILESEDFSKYVQQIGIPVSGSSVRITSRDVNDYMFPEGELYGST